MIQTVKTITQNKVIQKILTISFILTMSIIYPFIFHLFGIAGNVFLPIFLFVILGANYLDFKTIFSIAILVPLLNYLFTGMPIVAPMPILQMLTLELGMLIIFLKIFEKVNYLNIFSRIFSFIFARASSLILILFFENFTFKFWVNNFKIGIIGIVLNVLIVEFVLKIFRNRKKEY